MTCNNKEPCCILYIWTFSHFFHKKSLTISICSKLVTRKMKIEDLKNIFLKLHNLGQSNVWILICYTQKCRINKHSHFNVKVEQYTAVSQAFWGQCNVLIFLSISKLKSHSSNQNKNAQAFFRLYFHQIIYTITNVKYKYKYMGHVMLWKQYWPIIWFSNRK